MKKKEAIELANDNLGKTALRNDNTAYSGQLLKGNIWWTGLRQIKLQEDFYLLLLDDSGDRTKLILIEIPANSIRHPSRVFRTNMSGINEGRIQIHISNNPATYLQDVVSRKPGYDFRPFKRLEMIVQPSTTFRQGGRAKCRQSTPSQISGAAKPPTTP